MLWPPKYQAKGWSARKEEEVKVIRIRQRDITGKVICRGVSHFEGKGQEVTLQMGYQERGISQARKGVGLSGEGVGQSERVGNQERELYGH